jgi:hypothetical protein
MLKWNSLDYNYNTAWIRAIISFIFAYVYEFQNVQKSWNNLVWDTATTTTTTTIASSSSNEIRNVTAVDGREFVLVVLSSCVFAVMVNIVSVAIITRTTAIGYQVLGHSKTVGVITIDLLMKRHSTNSPEPVTSNTIKILIGACIALYGSWRYSNEMKKVKE